ncbi:MAG TPA: multidrug efflux RND transporter permease subunit [Gemmataceae bacterium]|nr:multidrug efflux RND transporter permease subunit [Gemmataceae bacterium]
MISHFFIRRPIFAAVLSIAITLAGGIAAFNLPLAQFPSISPPTVSVDCTYPGASAAIVSQSVATPIEQQVNGVEGMLYMASQCTNDGVYNLSVTFKTGVNINMAQVLVQNRVNLALPSLPDVVKQTGVTTKKRSPDILQVIQLYSPKGRYDQTHLSNYAVIRVRDELARLPGVSDVFVFGQRDYSMRIWLDPEKIAYRGLTATDVLNAVAEHNVPVPAGMIGQPPTPAGQAFTVPLKVTGRLEKAEEFEQIVVRATPDGKLVRLKDVARIELAALAQNISNRVNRMPAVGLAVFQAPDANALDVGKLVDVKIKELAKAFPEDIEWVYGYDTTPVTRESIGEVVHTLGEAIVLVACVVLLFLQNWRSAIIPLVAVPVAIIGTFAVMALFGFSLNTLTLFGMVLAIGIVVDDAIVVVESVEHHIEHGMKPVDAAYKAMEQVSGPVIAVGLVLSAVFVPCTFISGITGMFFRQFAMTIAVSTIISTFNSLTLSPALAAILLRPKQATRSEVLPFFLYVGIGGLCGWYFGVEPLTELLRERMPMLGTIPCDDAAPWLAALAGAVSLGLSSPLLDWLLSRLFRGFNFTFKAATNIYTRMIGGFLRVSILVLAVYGGLLVLTGWSITAMPRGFVPLQDMGYLLMNIQLPDAASLERTQKVNAQLEDILLAEPGIKIVSSVVGQSFFLNATGSNFGSVFIILKDFDQRRDPSMTSDAIANRIRKRLGEVRDAQVAVFGPPPIRGVGRSGGFKVMIEDRGDNTPTALQNQVEDIVDAGNKSGKLVGMSTIYRANVPQLFVDVDRKECKTRDIDLKDVFDTLQIYLGSYYVNDFNRFGRTWEVVLQADSGFRDKIEHVRKLRVRSGAGKMVPLGSVCKVREINGPLVLTRYNMYPAAALNGATAPGISSGQGIEIFNDLAARRQNLAGMHVEWTEMAYLELLSGNTAMWIFVLAVLMVFLVLAAQYESWSLPLAVILVVPMCLLCSIIGVFLAGHDVNIFTQIGFVVLVGLASKNAILIVEFAKQQRAAGESRRQATLDAVRLRLRPIIMTSLAFILGVVPLMTSRGAGAEMRRILGTAVFSGMLGVTLFGIFLTPVFFFVVDKLSEAPIWQHPFFRAIAASSHWSTWLRRMTSRRSALVSPTRKRGHRPDVDVEDIREPEPTGSGVGQN